MKRLVVVLLTASLLLGGLLVGAPAYGGAPAKAAADPRVRYLSFSRNFGFEAASTRKMRRVLNRGSTEAIDCLTVCTQRRGTPSSPRS